MICFKVSDCAWISSATTRFILQELATVLQQDQETLKRRAEDLSGSVHELENQLEKCAERERLLIAYPDLHKAEIPCMPESTFQYYCNAAAT